VPVSNRAQGLLASILGGIQLLDLMDLKNIVTKESYQIEATPLGGYIARPNKPGLDPIEGATKEDVERQIDAKIESSIEKALPDTFGKYGFTSRRSVSKFSYRLEEKPEGGFIARPSDPAMGVLEGVTKEAVQHKINERLGSLTGEPLADSFGNSNGINVTTNQQVSVQFLRGGSSAPSAIVGNQTRTSPASGIRVSFNSGSVGRIVRFLLTVVVVATVLYFYRRH
jgi:hypothetical protein